MNTAPFAVDLPGFEENPFDVLAVRKQRPRWTYSGRIHERSGLLDRVTQPFLGGPIDEPSAPFHVHHQKVSEDPLHPGVGISDALRSLFISERLGLSAKLGQRLVEMLALRPGWDGESAKPPRPEVLANVVGLLASMNTALPNCREPFLAPTIGGRALLEWHHGRRTLEFEATPDGWSVVGTEMTSRGGKDYHETEADRMETEKLIAAYRWFEGAEVLWPIT